MIDNKIETIVERLLDATKSGILNWEKIDSGIKNNTHTKWKCVAEDGTTYEMEVNYVVKNNKWQMEDYASMWIRNENLPNGTFFIYGGKSSNINSILKSIRKILTGDYVPTTDSLEYSLDVIALGISKEQHRESILTKLLSKIKK